jgi:ubiquitin-activating enzyme E1
MTFVVMIVMYTHMLYQVVVLTNAPLSLQLEINKWTHANDVHFIAAETHGLFG